MSRITIVATLFAACSLVGCSGPPKHSRTMSGEMPEPGSPSSADAEASGDADSAAFDPRQSIAAMDHEIQQWRIGSGMLPEPTTEIVAATRGISVAAIDAAAKPVPAPASELCIDTCNVKKSICGNADSICRIADDLAGDLWATGKCESAKGSCKEATELCVTCVTEENGG